jgi:uncharacterized protein (TIGR02594 family)
MTAWVKEASKYIGVKEIPGKKHEPKILQWWRAIRRGGIKTDEVPWCAAFVGACLENVGLVSTRFESARSYLAWGVRLERPIYGCVVVFSRNGGGHVGFLVGQDDKGRLMILGGNQNNQVSIAPFDPNRAIAFRWPKLIAIPQQANPLPRIRSSAKSSRNEV